MVNPPLSLDPGVLYACSNYEPGTKGGYERVAGYERLDGQNSPADASYWLVDFDAGTTAIVAGDVISNVASPASTDESGEVLANAVVTSGDWATNDAVGYFYVCKADGDFLSPAFLDNDTLYVSAASVATAFGNAEENGALIDADHATFLQDAMETLRARIDTLPGEGNVLGVWAFNNVVYGFRNKTGGATAGMYASSVTGWSEVDTGATMPFTAGNDAGGIGFVIGETITGAISTETARVVDAVTTSGDWTVGTAVGVLYLDTDSGAFQAETITGGTSSSTASGVAQTAVTLSPDGRYEFITENFYGNTSRRSMFGVDGVNLGFMFSADGFRQIPVAGMAADAPTHVVAHKKHLFYSFPGGSIQHSPIGDPGEPWVAVLGASEIATGDECTGFVTLPGDSLGIFNRNAIYVLYGTSVSNWELSSFDDESGAIEWSIQRMGMPLYLDDRGIMDFQAVDTYGDFANATISQLIQPIIDRKKGLVTASIRVKTKNQYRLFFSDKTFLTVSFDDRKLSGITPCEYPVSVLCSASVEDSSGNEKMYFGNNTGYVYEMDKGTNFDGAVVSAFMRLAFNYVGNPERKSRVFKVVLETESPDAIVISFTADYDYGKRKDITQDVTADGAAGIFNVSSWDEVFFNDQLVSNPEIHVNGSGKNIGIVVYTDHTYERPHKFSSAILHYSDRGLSR